MGPVLRYTTTSLDPAQVVGAARPLGATGFGRLGAAAKLSAEAPDTTRPEPRARVEVGASAFAPVWSADQSFGDVHAEAFRSPAAGRCGRAAAGAPPRREARLG